MKKVLLLFAAILMASTGMWAETVDYLYPVYNTDGVPTSGIKEWKTASVDATVVADASEPVTWTAGWYVVTGEDVTLSQGAICAGNVHLILADGAMLTATGIDDITNSTPGIQVSGDGNSLTIYGQTAQTGILKATGKTYSAGIGGISTNGLRDGSNITINGGTITADGGSQAAAIGGGLRGNGSNITINGGTVTARGSAAGIGGGCYGNGTNITINGGTVTARGGNNSDGIGNGENPTTPSSDIFVATWCIVKAGSSKTPSDVIENTGSDLATSLEGKQNVTVETPKFAVTYGDNITVSPAFASGAEIEAGTQITFTAADRTADSYGFWGFYEESTFDTPITTGVNGQAYTVTVTDAAISVYARYEKYASASYVYPVYNDPDDVTKGVEKWETGKVNAIEVTSSTEPVTLGERWTTTWYVVTGKDVTLSQGAICYGDVNLILADGAKLTATGADNEAGIRVSDEGNSLTIYGQAAQSGQLIATGEEYSAGIGGGSFGDGTNITINGGTVTANGGSNGAGIGGGTFGDGTNITINGGTVTANGGSDGAGIGGGYAGPIIFKGGQGSNIIINGGTVTANGGWHAAGIGSGTNGPAASDIFVANILTLKAGSTENPADAIINNGGDLAESLADKKYVTIEPNSVSYVYPVYNDPDDVTKGVKEWETGTASPIEITSSDTPVTLGEEGKTTWYVVTGSDVTLSQGAICYGDVNLILADGAKLTATGADDKAGITTAADLGNSLTIYGQTAQSGQLEATGGIHGAGIGGGNIRSCAEITINGGTVTANGGDGASGIGGGYNRSGYFITINGGKVKANGGEKAAGIGGGYYGIGDHITINGGTVEANGGEMAAGIGGGDHGIGSDITINDGTVTANGGVRAAGIGGGNYGNGSNITINDGTVTANGVVNGAGIGGGSDGNGNGITITGGTVTATGGKNATGIGGGDHGIGSDITINDGTVTANGGLCAAGIGGGIEGSGFNININGGTVTATGGESGVCIGSVNSANPASSIFVATNLIMKADGSNPPTTVIDNTGSDLALSLAGKQYATITEPYFNITANQDPDDETHYYSTFYSSRCDYQVPEGTTAYTGVAEGDVLKLTPIADGIIPAGEAVILRLITEDDTDASQQIVLTATTTTATKSDDNMLQGSDEPMTLPQNSYALSYGQHQLGFYDFSGSVLPANKAYLTLDASAAQSVGLRFSFDDTTEIDAPVAEPANAPAYNLQGQQVDETYKGIVIVNGKKVLKR